MATNKKPSKLNKPRRFTSLLTALLEILPVVVSAFEQEGADKTPTSILVQSDVGYGKAFVSIAKPSDDHSVLNP